MYFHFAQRCKIQQIDSEKYTLFLRVHTLTLTSLVDEGGGSRAPDVAGRPSHISLFEVLVSGRNPSLELGASSPARAGSAVETLDIQSRKVTNLESQLRRTHTANELAPITEVEHEETVVEELEAIGVGAMSQKPRFCGHNQGYEMSP